MPDTHVLINQNDIVKFIGCSDEYYVSQNNTTDPYYENTVYFVNSGSTIGGHLCSDLYIGSRKITDLYIVNDYPGSAGYPDDKIYIKPTYDAAGKTVISYQVYFKHQGITTPLETSALAGAYYDDSAVSPQMVITWNFHDKEGNLVTTRLLTLTDDGNMPEGIMNVIVSTVYEEVAKRVTTRWKSILN